MNIETFREYCLSKKGVSEEFPFDEQTLVFKVMGKMFALTNIDSFVSINLKCNPENAELLREQYDAVKPGYHMNKKHWNTLMIDGSLPDKLIYQWIDNSYDLVVATLTKKLKQELAML
jgi:predicted DNA-binding protein (MmcQ/YjbR family)